ncbi:MAG: hypothetical protein L0Y62_02605 [Nitrospirae bacterium]|nr:hypothetical protein [Nitrospirota bacterium]
MRILILIAVAVSFLFSFGCVTKDYVKQQIDPLVDRISKLEAKQNECCEKADAAAKKIKKAFELQQKK